MHRYCHSPQIGTISSSTILHNTNYDGYGEPRVGKIDCSAPIVHVLFPLATNSVPISAILVALLLHLDMVHSNLC